jgi:membrane-associated phospholipid phosphatase
MVLQLPGSQAVKKRWIGAFVFLAGIVLATLSYNLWDIPLAYYCKGLSRSVLDIAETVTIAGESKWYYILFVPAYIVYRFLLRNNLWSKRILFLFLSISASGLINMLIKWLTGRNRPINLFKSGLFGFNYLKVVYESTSFPSGHTVTAFALATAIAIIYPRWSIPAFTAALAIGISRILITSHYLSDVIAGAGVGILCVLALKFIFDRLNVEVTEKERCG